MDRIRSTLMEQGRMNATLTKLVSTLHTLLVGDRLPSKAMLQRNLPNWSSQVMSPAKNGFSQAKEQDFTINVAMPANFNCIGASTGNICTVRCRNTAVAGPFGGCSVVQQTDGTGRKNTTCCDCSEPGCWSWWW